jgi:chitinase
MSTEIKQCQAKGKIVTLSIGGATGKVGFNSDTQAISFAKTIWNSFLGGSSSTRPFGNAVLDGSAKTHSVSPSSFSLGKYAHSVDLDIESGSPAHYSAFVNEIRSLAKDAHKR